jgi:hypothetical protein
MTEQHAAPKMADPKPEPKVEPKADPKATYETREAIMACGCRIIMDAATYDAEGAHCAVHDNTEVVRVIKNAPVEVPDAPVATAKNGNGKKAVAVAAVKK